MLPKTKSANALLQKVVSISSIGIGLQRRRPNRSGETLENSPLFAGLDCMRRDAANLLVTELE